MNRYFSLIPVVIIFTTACDQKAPTVESAPRMVKVAQVTAVGNTQQRTFPARIESGDSTELSFKRGGQVESLDIRQGASVAQANAGAPGMPARPSNGSMSGKRRPLSPSVSSTASRLWPGARRFPVRRWTCSAPIAMPPMRP